MTSHLIQGLPDAGEIVSWGDDTFNQVKDAPKGKDFREVVPGGALQSLAIRRNGMLELWGGVGATTPVIPALAGPGVRKSVTALGEYLDASISVTHFVAIRTDSTLAPWIDFLTSGPVVPPTGLHVQAVASNSNADVAIKMDGSLTQWGAIAASPSGTFTKVSARGDYAIALRDDGRLFGWGGSLFATLPGWTSDGAGHFYIDGPFTDLAAGVIQKRPLKPDPHLLALKSDGTVMGWGANTFGETDAPSGVLFRTIAAGNGYSLGLDMLGQLHHWGFGGGSVKESGEVLKGLSNTPKGRFISISAASRHAAAVRVSH